MKELWKQVLFHFVQKRPLPCRPSMKALISLIFIGTNTSGDEELGKLIRLYRWGSIPIGITSLCILWKHSLSISKMFEVTGSHRD